MPRPAAPREIRECARQDCKEVFEVRTTDERIYCTRSCARTVENQQRSLDKRSAYDANPKVCPCGGSISYEWRSGHKHCSPECVVLYGKKRQADPSNHRTFTCKTCGEEVSRPRSSHPFARFCSNRCAAKHTHKVRHIGINDSDVVLDSGYEALLWGLATFLKVPIERFDRANGIALGTDGWYAPDFILNGQHVEVKGLEDEDDRQRYEAWRQQKGPLVVLDHEALDALRQAIDRHQFEAIIALYREVLIHA